MELRHYQIEAVQAIQNEWQNGIKNTLLVMATGTGKTVVFSEVIRSCVEAGHRVLIIAHRDELLQQAADKLKKSCDLEAVFEKADSHSIGSVEKITISSVQTMSRPARLRQFPPDYFDEIIIDEAHHSMSDSYKRVLDYFQNAHILGVTATPDRGDKRQLGEIFETTCYEYGMSQAINDGFLCRITSKMLPLKIDLNSVRTVAGDYNEAELGTALTPYLHEIARQMTEWCADRKTVVFLPLIKTSQTFCKMLNDVGFRAAEVNGTSPDRIEILQNFESGKFNVLCNSMLLTEGWDCPSVDCVVVLRPTQIRSLYQQMIGRGTRLSEGKKDLLVLDFLWLTKQHDLCHPSALIAKDEKTAEKIDRALEDGEEVDLLEKEDELERQERESAEKQRQEALAKRLRENIHRQAKTVDPIAYALSIDAEDLADYSPMFDWEFDKPTEKQLLWLEKFGFNRADIPSKGYASMLLDKLFARKNAHLTSPKQIYDLEKIGFRNVGTWSYQLAARLIKRLDDLNWVLPPNFQPETYNPNRKKL